MQILKNIFKRKVKSRLKSKLRLEVEKELKFESDHPRQKNGQFKRHIPCNFMGQQVDTIYL